jgi:hypothetical protein
VPAAIAAWGRIIGAKFRSDWVDGVLRAWPLRASMVSFETDTALQVKYNHAKITTITDAFIHLKAQAMMLFRDLFSTF